jgi:hypothetical protein
VSCYAVSVPDAAVPTSVSSSGPTVRMTPVRPERAAPCLKKAGQELVCYLSGDAAKARVARWSAGRRPSGIVHIVLMSVLRGAPRNEEAFR